MATGQVLHMPSHMSTLLPADVSIHLSVRVSVVMSIHMSAVPSQIRNSHGFRVPALHRPGVRMDMRTGMRIDVCTPLPIWNWNGFWSGSFVDQNFLFRLLS